VAKRGLAEHVRTSRARGSDVDPAKAAAFEARFDELGNGPHVEDAPPEKSATASTSRKVPKPPVEAAAKPPPESAGSRKRRASAGKRFVVLLPEEVIAELRVAAARDGRSLSNAVEAAIAHWLASGRPDLLPYD